MKGSIVWRLLVPRENDGIMIRGHKVVQLQYGERNTGHLAPEAPQRHIFIHEVCVFIGQMSDVNLISPQDLSM